MYTIKKKKSFKFAYIATDKNIVQIYGVSHESDSKLKKIKSISSFLMFNNFKTGF